MSSKINIIGIIQDHFNTLCDTQGKRLKIDIFIFYVIPLIVSLLFVFTSLNLNAKTIPLLVNFGSIFTALLLSVLVLVYDQKDKLESIKNPTGQTNNKKQLVVHLFNNISYSILMSIILVILCFIHTMLTGVKSEINGFTLKYDDYISAPFIIFITLNLLMSILMIVKRMHILLSK